MCILLLFFEKYVSKFLQKAGIINRTLKPSQYKNTPTRKYITLWHFLLYYTEAKLEQLENRINLGCRQWKWNLWGEWQNTHGKITTPMKIFIRI